MPDATVSTETTKHDLKSLSGAFVELKPLPYGSALTRRESAMKMSMEQGGNRAARRRGEAQGSGKIDVELLQRWARAYEFKHCIVDHNLTNRENQKLDFGNPMTLDILDPKIGTEIERLIDEINGEETEEDLEPFTLSASDSSEDTTQE